MCYGGELCPPPAVRALDLGGTHVTLSEAGECSDALFGALRQMAQERLGVQIRSEKLL